MGNDVTIFQHGVVVKLFWLVFVSLVNLSYRSKFYVNVITGSGVMTISFYKGLTKTPEIVNIHVWVLPNIWRLGPLRNTKFGANVPNKIFLNATKFQGCNFHRLWVIKQQPITPHPHLTPTPRRLGLKSISISEILTCLISKRLVTISFPCRSCLPCI